MDEQTQAILASLIRHGLTTLGGMLAAKGYIDSGQIAEVVGGTMVLIGAGWGWWQKQGQAQAAEALKKLTTKTPAQAASISTTAAVEVAKALPAGSAVTPGLPVTGSVGRAA